jgi:hypothetical protein
VTRFPIPIQTGPRVHPTSYTIGTESFKGVNLTERGVDNPPPCSAEGKERTELYLYSLSWRRLLVLGLTLPLLLTLRFTHWIVSSEGYISYLYGMTLLGIERRLFGFTTCSPVTILIMLTQLPLLASSWSVLPGSYNIKAVPLNCIHFNTIHIPGLPLLISNLIPYRCVQVNGRSTDCDHLFLPIYWLYLSLDAFAR